MRAYLGVTAHYIALDCKDKCYKLNSSLLACERFTGSQTGDRIASELQATMDRYAIQQTVDCVLTDNAANLRKALTLTFTCNNDDGDIGMKLNDALQQDQVDDPDLWNALEDDDDYEVNNVIASHCRRERLPCFDHTLH